MAIPYVCAKCGTSFSSGAVESLKCGVCGGPLRERATASDPAPSRKGEGWLWLAAFPWELVALGLAVIAGLAAFLKSWQ